MAVDNLEIAKQLKKLQEELNDLVEAQTKSLRSQLDVSKQIAESLSQVTNNSGETVGNIQKTQESLEKGAAAAERLGGKGTTAKFAENLKKSHKAGESLSKSLTKSLKLLPGFATFGGIWSGFTAGITGTANALKLLGGTTLSALEGLGQLALAVITFPFRILSILTDFASKGGGDSGLRQALEDIRKEFGDLRKSGAKAIVDISRGMKGELANTGISVWRTFGRLAERLKTIAEYAKNMGNVFTAISRQFVAHGEVIAAYIKGLHLTEEGQKALATRSHATGTSMVELGREIANYSVQLGDSFGLNAAEISQDMGDMMADFEHFGSLAPQVLAQVSVYARRLGVDVKGLLGVVEQFDNFEGAATSAAQLTQAFGLQLDALELLKAEDPAERTEMIRKSFFAAGRSIENMTRQERALLATQTGLDASAVDLVFSSKNQGLSYDQVKKKSEGARKSQLTQAESLQKIAGAIERLVRSGSMGGGGFFERFFQGFERGLTRSAEFREIMVNIRIALRETYRAGIAVGQAFVDMFPGVRQLLQGIADLFDTERFKNMTMELRTIFRDFFTSLTSTSGRDSFKNLMERLKSMFWDYFSASTPAGRGILEGVRNFSKAAAVIFAGLIREAAAGITSGIRFISDLLSGRKSLGVGAAGEGALGFIMELLEPIIDALKEAWPPIVEALTQLWEEEVWPRVKNFVWEHKGIILLALFGPAILRSIVGGIAGAFAGSVTAGLTRGVTTGVAELATSGSVRSALTKGISSVFSMGAGATTAAIAEAGPAAAAASTSPAAIPAADGAARRVAVFVAGGMAAVVVAIMALVGFMLATGASETQMLAAAGVMAVAGLVMLELSGVVSVIAGVGAVIEGLAPQFLAGMVALGVISAAMGVGVVAMVYALSGFNMEELASAALAMAAGGTFFLAAGAVLAIATAVGVGLLTGVGIAGALVGFAALYLTTQAMVEQVQNIVHEVSQLNIPGDFDRKFDIFTQALGAITTFGELVARISESSSHSSLWGWVTGGSADDQIAVMDQLGETIEMMGDQMIRLVRSVLQQVSTLRASPATLKKAEIFGTIMTAVGSLMTGLQGPAELLTAGGGILSYIIGNDLAGTLSNYSIFVENMGVSLGNVLRDVMAQLTGPLANTTFAEGAAERFEVVGHILEILGALGRSMIMTITNNFSHLSGTAFTDRIAEVSDAVGDLLSGMFSGGGGGLIETIGTLITQLVGSLSGISERDASRLTTLGPVLVSMFGAIAQIGLTVSDLSALATSIPAEARGEALGTINALVQNMLGGIGTIVTSLLTSVRDIFAGMSRSESTALKTGVEAFKGMIEAITTLPGALKTLQQTLNATGTDDYTTMRQRLGTLISLFYRTDNAGNPGLPILFEQMIIMFNSLPAVTGDPATKLEALSKSLNSIQQIASIPFEDVISGITANTASLADGSFTQLGTNLKAMIDEVNCIATQLGSMEVIEINTSLQALAGRLGLGDSAELTITNRNFAINVAVNVHMDARVLEGVLTERTGNTFLTTTNRSGAG